MTADQNSVISLDIINDRSKFHKLVELTSPVPIFHGPFKAHGYGCVLDRDTATIRWNVIYSPEWPFRAEIWIRRSQVPNLVHESGEKWSLVPPESKASAYYNSTSTPMRYTLDDLEDFDSGEDLYYHLSDFLKSRQQLQDLKPFLDHLSLVYTSKSQKQQLFTDLILKIQQDAEDLQAIPVFCTHLWHAATAEGQAILHEAYTCLLKFEGKRVMHFKYNTEVD